MAPSLRNKVAISEWRLTSGLLGMRTLNVNRLGFTGSRAAPNARSAELSLLKEGCRSEGRAVGQEGILFPVRALVVGKFVQASWTVLNKFLLHCSLYRDYNQLSKQFHGPERKLE